MDETRTRRGPWQRFTFAAVTMLALLAGGLVAASTAQAAGCIASDDGSRINAELAAGGADTTVTICPGATIELTETITYTADRQTVTSDPDDRPRLVLSTPEILTAVSMLAVDDATLSNVVVDGNRAGRAATYPASKALIEVGAITATHGKVTGLTVKNIRAQNSRNGALLHVLRWVNCTKASILDSEFVDAGYDFTDSVGTKVNDVKPGQAWADGIRLDCSNSVVRGNTIIDATDAGIVIFGSPGSIVEDNHIIQRTKTLLGAINLVDNTTNGNYTGVIVRNNTITADGGLIRSAIGMGNPVWSCGNTTVQPYFGAQVTGNRLEGSTMGWGYSAVRVRDWVATGNVDASTHIGIAAIQCDGYYALPTGFDYTADKATPLDRVSGEFQPEFVDTHINDLLFHTDPF